MKQQKLRGIDIELICKYKLEYMFMVSLISSDNIRTIEEAEQSLDFIDEVEEAVKASNLTKEKKEEFENYITEGRSILKADIERFNENK